MMATGLIVIALGAGAIGYRRLGGGANQPAETIEAVSALASPSASPRSLPVTDLPARLEACTVEPRWGGYTEQMLGETAWEVSTWFPIGGFVVVAGDYYVAGLAPVSDAIVDEVDAAMVQLWACQVWDRRGDFVPGANPDDRSWAMYSDNFLRRHLTQRHLPAGVDRLMALSGLPLQQIAPTEAYRVWDLGDADAPRVAVQLPRSARASGDPDQDWGWLVILIKEGETWKVDEFTGAMFDDRPTPLATSLDGVETVDVVMHDLGSLASPGNEGSIGQLADVNEFYTGGGLLLRLHNAGMLPHRFEIPELGISIDVAPGTSEQLVVDAPAGTTMLDFTIHEGIEPDTTVTAGSIPFIEPGTPHICCG